MAVENDLSIDDFPIKPPFIVDSPWQTVSHNQMVSMETFDPQKPFQPGFGFFSHPGFLGWGPKGSKRCCQRLNSVERKKVFLTRELRTPSEMVSLTSSVSELPESRRHSCPFPIG